MKCPFCHQDDTQVVDSRVAESGDSVRRRRRCVVCQKRFTTYETVELRLPQVIKSDSRRTEFSEAKLRTGFLRALHKRPVKTEAVDDAVTRVKEQLLAMGEREVPSRVVGEMVMAELSKLDQIAYVRFASVYRSFNDVSDFHDVIETIKKSDADE